MKYPYSQDENYGIISRINSHDEIVRRRSDAHIPNVTKSKASIQQRHHHDRYFDNRNIRNYCIPYHVSLWYHFLMEYCHESSRNLHDQVPISTKTTTTTTEAYCPRCVEAAVRRQQKQDGFDDITASTTPTESTHIQHSRQIRTSSPKLSQCYNAPMNESETATWNHIASNNNITTTFTSPPAQTTSSPLKSLLLSLLHLIIITLLISSLIPTLEASPFNLITSPTTCSSLAATSSSSQEQYYNYLAFKCETCDNVYANGASRMQPSGYNCTCLEGYSFDWNSGSSVYSCEECATGSATSRLREKCLTCPNGYDASSKTCQACPSGQYLAERDSLGVLFSSAKQCVSCGPSTLGEDPTNRFACRACPDASMTRVGSACECASGYTLYGDRECIFSTPYSQFLSQFGLDAATKITYQNLEDETSSLTRQVQSYILIRDFFPSAAKCDQVRDQQSCQALANFCAISLYDSTNVACRLYRQLWEAETQTLHNVEGWKDNLPWLYYYNPSTTTNLDNSVILEATDISTRYSFAQRLTFMLSVYSVNGTWLGYRSMEDELILCSGGALESTQWMWLGHSQEISCNFNVKSLLNRDEPEFYDLYLLDGDSNVLYPVPVRISNMKTDQLVRRFTTFDNAFSKTSESAEPVVLRFLSSVNIDLKMSGSQLYPPLVTLTYSERLTSSLVSTEYPNFLTSSDASMSTPSIYFSAYYTTNFTSHWIAIVVMSILFSIIAVVVLVGQVLVRQRGRDRFVVNGSFLLEVVGNLFCNISDALCVVLISMCMFWYWAFKYGTHEFAPARGVELAPYIVLLVLAFLFKSVDLACTLWKQVTYDVFFIDWEKSAGTMRTIEMREQDAPDGASSSDDNPTTKRENAHSQKKENEPTEEEEETRSSSLTTTTRSRRRTRSGRRFARRTRSNSTNANNDSTSNNNQASSSADVPQEPQSQTNEDNMSEKTTTTTSTTTKNKKNGILTVPVSIWRSIYIAREWKLLNNTRVVNFDFTFLVLLMILIGFNVIYLGNAIPGDDNLNHSELSSPVLRFWITTMIWILLFFFPYFFNRLFYFQFWFDPVKKFVRQCAESNISVFVLRSDNYGFYIHGETGVSSDTSVKQFHSNLQIAEDEKPEDERNARQLLGNLAPEDHCFEMYLTTDSWKKYANHKMLPRNTKKNQIGTTSNTSEFVRDIRLYNFIMLKGQRAPTTVLSRARRRMNRHLQTLINNIRSNFKERSLNPTNDSIHERLITDRFGIPPAMREAQKDFLISDNSFRLCSLLVRGIEIKLFTFNVLLFGVVDLFMPSSIWSFVVVYIVHKLILGLRSYFERLNIIRKAMLDERFLI